MSASQQKRSCDNFGILLYKVRGRDVGHIIENNQFVTINEIALQCAYAEME